MADITTAPLREITADDVRGFVGEEGYPEGDQLEFKQELPARGNGQPDGWMQGEDRVGDRARNELLEEIVAFANAHGGMLIIGIEESDDHPKRAVGLTPVPRCAELAARLRLQARDCIEPSLPVIEIEGVPTAADGSGVVIARVPQSRLAPHRLRPTLECYYRRADRSEKMTMREIQDLTLQRVSAMERVEAAFADRSSAFLKRVDEVINAGSNANAIGIRVTVIPVGTSLFLPRVHGNAQVAPRFDTYEGVLGAVTVRAYLPVPGFESRPILRGTRLDSRDPGISIRLEVHADGLIEYSMISFISHKMDDVVIPEWVFGLATNALMTAHRFRTAAGASGAEFGIEVELVRRNGALRLTRWGTDRAPATAAPIEENPLRLPRLSFGTVDELSPILDTMYRDLMNAAGLDLRDANFSIKLPG